MSVPFVHLLQYERLPLPEPEYRFHEASRWPDCPFEGTEKLGHTNVSPEHYQDAFQAAYNHERARVSQVGGAS